MSKIKDVKIKKEILYITLESGIQINEHIPIEKNYFKDVKNKIVGIEIFDQRSIDNKLKETSSSRSIVFNISKLILKLGARESNVSISDYIGKENKEKKENNLIIDINDFLTITDLIENVLMLKKDNNIIIMGNDELVNDLAIGLGVDTK